MEIPEENSVQLQNAQVHDQTHRETTGDFLDSDAVKLSPIDEESAPKRTQVSSKSKRHRKALQYHHRKRAPRLPEGDHHTASSDANDKNQTQQDESFEISLDCANTLAKPNQTVLDDIAEVISSRDSETNCKASSDDSRAEQANTQKDGAFQNDMQEVSVQETTISFQEEELDQWQTLCDKLQTYTLEDNTESSRVAH